MYWYACPKTLPQSNVYTSKGTKEQLVVVTIRGSDR